MKEWLHKDYITKQQYYGLRLIDRPLPKAYGIPKIHKEGSSVEDNRLINK